MRKLIAGIFAVSIWCTIASGCSWWEKEESQKELAATEAIATEISTEPQLPKDVAEMVAAIQKTAALEAFRLDTKAEINLNGKLIAGRYIIDSNIEILNEEKEDNLLMKMETNSDMNGEISNAAAYYEDGWYYTEDEEGIKKEEKSPEDVLEGVTDITAMVIDAAEKIQDMKVTEEGNKRVYTYTIPAYEAEKYFALVIDTLAQDNPDIAGATAEVETIKLVSKVNKKGMLVQQNLALGGSVMQTIFKIPAEIQITAAFEEIDKEN